jgi:hypothetical protein
MNICQKYKDQSEKIYNEIIKESTKLKGHSEAELRYLLREKIEKFMNAIEEKRPIFLEEQRIDVLVGDIVIETKRFGELTSGKKKLNNYEKKTKEYMQKYSSPFGILTDLKKIYFYELKEDGAISKIDGKSDDFNYDNFCFLLSILFGERKKFISEISLTTDFGYITKNKLISDLLNKLYRLFKSSRTKKSEMIFSEWQKLFKLAETTNKEYLKMRRDALEGYFGIEINEENEYICIFVMHTLLSLIVKLLTYSFLGHLNNWKITKEENISALKNFYERLEKGEIFREMGIINMCQNDFFSWYLYEAWDNEFFRLLLSLKNRASLYRYIKSDDPMKLKDALQKLYENFIPREIRHSFGEYYTPPSISDFMVMEAKNFLNDIIRYRAIDPTCGSGTFLISLLKDKIFNEENKKYSMRKIMNEVVGIDLNPIAVLMSKFNYLLAVYPYLKENEDITDIEIPVYLGDSSYMPTEEIIDGIKCLTYEYYFPRDMQIEFPKIVFPMEFIRSNNFLPALIKVEEMIERGETDKKISEFLFSSIGKHLLNDKIKEQIAVLISHIIEYQKKKLNTIWLFIFMNYLKPFALQKFDLIIGNPPWVRWSVLPRDYKDKIKKSLRQEGVFSRDTNYGGVDLNVCALIAYRVIENLSNTEGLLGFLFPQGILINKSYEGFRNFTFGNKKAYPVLILKPTKPFFSGEEPIILFLKIIEN